MSALICLAAGLRRRSRPGAGGAGHRPPILAGSGASAWRPRGLSATPPRFSAARPARLALAPPNRCRHPWHTAASSNVFVSQIGHDFMLSLPLSAPLVCPWRLGSCVRPPDAARGRLRGLCGRHLLAPSPWPALWRRACTPRALAPGSPRAWPGLRRGPCHAGRTSQRRG